VLEIAFLVLALAAFIASGLLHLAGSSHAPALTAFGLALLTLAFLAPHFATMH